MTDFAKVEIGTTGEFLDGVKVTTPAGEDLFRETQVAADPVEADALARVRAVAPAVNDFGLVVRQAGPVTALSALVPAEFDGIELGYTGEKLTSVVYRQGMTVVATLTLGYTGDKMTSVVRS